MKALVLVDLQNDFLPGGALVVPGSPTLIPVVNQLQGRFRLVVATQDWHPRNHGCFAANHPGCKPGEIVQLRKSAQLLWPVHCVQGTHGAELVPALSLNRVNKVIRKGTDADMDSYSAFFDNGHLRATGLNEFLREKRVTDVYLCGLPTDYGVKFTALDAVDLGFKTFLIEDTCRGLDLKPDDVSRSIAEMTQAGVVLVQSRDIL